MKSNKNNAVAMQEFDNEQVSVHSVVTKYHGFFKMNEYSLQHKLFSGEQSQVFTREVFERGDAVVVMPYDARRDTVLLIEQFRAGAIRGEDSPWLLEFIAGMFDDNESPVEVAIREAKEETDLTLSAENLVPIMEYLSSPGGMSERIHLYLAHFDSELVIEGATHGLPEENEDILLHLVSRTHAMELLSQGKITNAATIIGLQWLALNYQSLSL
ncbi:NUDIX domain-containing protein [Colwellia psychrerythraea]|uniref:ADP-ribose pyrophosphatase n=1 Tax=Colwellia psychrerythraea TaxID=28229 RepID=A0A099L0A6_COLPS|nr:NUDIX domain-containing protein [Colwellia psychrerythraea]KGJ95537.1 nucleoside diphosphate pyrophosphatase [Colwellia psychrerythraea]